LTRFQVKQSASRFERMLWARHFVVTCELNPHDSDIIDIMDLDFRRWFPTPEIVEAAGLTTRPQLEME
jgi:hypothetical protein